MTGEEYTYLKPNDKLVVVYSCEFVGAKGNLYEVVYRDKFSDVIYIKLIDKSPNDTRTGLNVGDIKIIRPEQAFSYFELYTKDFIKQKPNPKFKIGDSFWIMLNNKPVFKTVTGIRTEERYSDTNKYIVKIRYAVDYSYEYNYTEDEMFKTKEELIKSL